MILKKNFLIWFLNCSFISGIVFLFLCPFSCRVTEEGFVLFTDNSGGPAIEDFLVTGEKSCRIIFNSQVTVKEKSITPKVEILDALVSPGKNNGLCYVDFVFGDVLAVGECFRLYGEVQDNVGNTLTFSLPLLGFNSNVPEIVLTEIHPMYGSSNTKSGTVYKCEYVEMLVTKSGNLSGLKLYSAYDGKDKAYDFPAINVVAGEIITVHLRKKEGMEAVSETGMELNLSRTYYSSEDSRDLWDDNDSARLGDSMDVILLINSADGNILDGVCYAPEQSEVWKTQEMLQACEKLVSAGLWKSSEVNFAVKSDGITLSKAVEKVSCGIGGDCWCLSSTSGTNPGKVSFYK